MSDPQDKDKTQPEDQPGETGAEGGARHEDEEKAPFDSSEEDDSALGDTDQHSDAPA